MSRTVNLAADGNSEGIKLISPPEEGSAGVIKTVTVYGDFGSGTATIGFSPDGGTTWHTVQESGVNVEFTAEGSKNLEVCAPGSEVDGTLPQLRLQLTGSSSPDLNMTVNGRTQ